MPSSHGGRHRGGQALAPELQDDGREAARHQPEEARGARPSLLGSNGGLTRDPRGAAAQEEDRINELFKKHDTNQSESLHDAQLKAFMQEYVKLLPGMEEKRVADAEVK